MSQKSNPWMIVSIILMVVVVIESIFLIMLFNIGYEYEKKEYECSINYCGTMDSYISYYFDYYTSICYCYDGDGNVIDHRYLD